jgi:hypothetical protein
MMFDEQVGDVESTVRGRIRASSVHISMVDNEWLVRRLKALKVAA